MHRCTLSHSDRTSIILLLPLNSPASPFTSIDLSVNMSLILATPAHFVRIGLVWGAKSCFEWIQMYLVGHHLFGYNGPTATKINPLLVNGKAGEIYGTRSLTVHTPCALGPYVQEQRQPDSPSSIFGLLLIRLANFCGSNSRTSSRSPWSGSS
jgi:hypothetical protein